MPSHYHIVFYHITFLVTNDKNILLSNCYCFRQYTRAQAIRRNLVLICIWLTGLGGGMISTDYCINCGYCAKAPAFQKLNTYLWKSVPFFYVHFYFQKIAPDKMSPQTPTWKHQYNALWDHLRKLCSAAAGLFCLHNITKKIKGREFLQDTWQ